MFAFATCSKLLFQVVFVMSNGQRLICQVFHQQEGIAGMRHQRPREVCCIFQCKGFLSVCMTLKTKNKKISPFITNSPGCFVLNNFVLLAGREIDFV